MWLGVVLLFLFSLALPVSGAEDFTVTVTPESRSLSSDEQVKVTVDITNNLGAKDTFRISIPDVIWSVQSEPLDDYFSGVTVRNEDTERIMLLFSTTENLPSGPYQIAYVILAEDADMKKEGSFFISVRSNEPLIRDYLATVPHLVDVPDVINPGKETSITFHLENKGVQKIDLNITINSDIVNEELNVTLDGLSRRIVDVPIIIPEETPPQEATLHILFSMNGTVLQPTLTESYTIPKKTQIVAGEKSEKRDFLQNTITRNYTNKGNVVSSENLIFPTDFFQSFFTRTNALHRQETRDGKQVLVVTLNLQPGETKELNVVRDYRPPVVIAIVIVVAIAFYLFFRNAVKISKQATILSFKEGGISEIKVTIHIVNRTKKTFAMIKLKDSIPSLAQLSKGGMGTLKPTQHHQGKRATHLVWELETLESKDEFVITYKVHTKLSILGRFILPAVKVDYHDKNNNKFVAESKQVRIIP